MDFIQTNQHFKKMSSPSQRAVSAGIAGIGWLTSIVAMFVVGSKEFSGAAWFVNILTLVTVLIAFIDRTEKLKLMIVAFAAISITLLVQTTILLELGGLITVPSEITAYIAGNMVTLIGFLMLIMGLGNAENEKPSVRAVQPTPV